MIAFYVNVHFSDDNHNYFTVDDVATPLDALAAVTEYLKNDPASFSQILSMKVIETIKL